VDRDRKIDVATAVLLLLAPTILVLASPYLFRIEWLSGHWGTRILKSVAGLACALGIWRLKVILGWSFRTIGGRTLLLAAAPAYLGPMWWLAEGPYRSLTLRPCELPGYRIALPDWKVQQQGDYWTGQAKAMRPGSEDLVAFGWGAGASDESTDEVVGAELVKMGMTADGVEPRSVASRPTTIRYYRDGSTGGLARATFSCADGRYAALVVAVGTDRDTLRKLVSRILDTVACVAAAPPAMVFPKLSVPSGFRVVARIGNRVVYGTDGEQLWLMAAEPHAMVEPLADRDVRTALIDVLAKGMGLTVDGEIEVLREREAWTVRVRDGDDEDIVQRLGIRRLSCGEREFLPAYVGPLDDKKRPLERLDRVTCP
jgi:hypothetical protein